VNILYLINHAGQGGTEKYIRVLAEDMKKRGHTVFLVYNETGRLVAEVESLGIETIKLEMKSPFDSKASKTLKNICKEKKIDIIHTQFARENYIAIRSKGAKVIHTSHIMLRNDFAWKILNRMFMGRNKQIIALCELSKRILIENKYPKNKITVIPNGVVFKEDVEIAPISDVFKFVTVTRFSEEKGIFFLLDAIKELKKKAQNFEVAFVGDGELLEEAKEYTKTNDIAENTIFYGYREDVEDILKNSNCFINSSQSEVISFAILEAMSVGLPIIATNVGGTPDIVNEKTNCGILADYGDVVAFSAGMYKIMNDVEFLRECALNSQKAIKDIFNIENVLKKIYLTYEEGIK